MKKKYLRLISGMIVSLLLTVSLAACGGTDTGTKATETQSGTSAQTSAAQETAAQQSIAELKEVELTFMFFGDTPAGMEDVLEEFETKTKNQLNTKIEMLFTPFGEFKNKVKLKTAAGENIDAVFDAPWWGMTEAISKDSYQKLDQYFLNDQYPGLKKAFNEKFVNNNKFNGNMYGIPFAQGYKSINGFFIRKDLREKFGMDKIDRFDELEEYFDNVKKYNPTMIPLADDGASMRWAYGFNDENDNYNAKQHVFPVQFGQIWGSVKMSDDNKKVVYIEMPGQATKAKIGQPYDTALISPRWKNENYFEKDVLTQQNASGLFTAGKAASLAHEVTRWPTLTSGLSAAVEGGTVEFFISSDSQRVFGENAMKTDYKTSNYICIPTSSKNTDAVMKFFDYMFSNQEMHDLFELGIAGKDWTPVGEDKYTVIEGSKYAFPGYEMTWNSTMMRLMDGMDSDYYTIMDYQLKDSCYYSTPLSGFTFDTVPVKNDLLKVTDVAAKIGQIYSSGIYGDDTYKKAHEEYIKGTKLGFDKIAEEAKVQIEKYLAEHN